MESLENPRIVPASNLSIILVGLSFLLLLVNIAAYGCSWYGRKPMPPEETRKSSKDGYYEGKKPWNTAVFYLLGTSTIITFVEMITIMWQAWVLHRTSKTQDLKRRNLQEAQEFI